MIALRVFVRNKCDRPVKEADDVVAEVVGGLAGLTHPIQNIPDLFVVFELKNGIFSADPDRRKQRWYICTVKHGKNVFPGRILICHVADLFVRENDEPHPL